MSEVPSVSIGGGSAGGAEDDLRAFQQSVRDVFRAEPRPPGPGAAPGSGVTARAWHLGSLMLGVFSGPALTFTRSRELVASSGLSHVLLQIYLEGGFEGSAGERTIRVAPGDICLFDLEQTLQTEASAFSNCSLLLPRAALPATGAHVAGLHGEVLPANHPVTGVLGDHLMSLARRLPGMDNADALTTSKATAAMVDVLLFSIVQVALRDSVGAGAQGFCSRILAYIDEHIDDPDLNPERIAESLGMSRAALYRAFGRSGGINRLIRRRRLTGAALEIADPSRSVLIKEVAGRWGFHNIQHFTTAFRETFGVTPTQARARSLFSVGGGAEDGDPARAPTRLAAWMRELRAAPPTRRDGTR